MNILGIETSCDETSAAVVVDGKTILSHVISSSIQDQAAFGGVVPEIAARRQLECIVPVIKQSLNEAGLAGEKMDAIAVTRGPGLLTSLLVGTTASRILASVFQKPLIGVHHTLGHLSSPWLECSDAIRFPLLTLSVSGGHTDLWLRESHTRNTLLGRTLDDAAGEAFDKGATLFHLPYPGGPALSKMAAGGNPSCISFTQPLQGVKTCDFSFSGLKTALKYALRDRGGVQVLSSAERCDIAASFEDAICKHLLSRLKCALENQRDIHEVHVVGGVSANSRLRTMLESTMRSQEIILRLPKEMPYCTDNAAMIAAAGYFLHLERGSDAVRPFETRASISLEG